ncbi:hypothetical protein K438DRAFT_1763967 [Mycena galopus ATCC 62051]|nr:hypothetical protein K438DRAFT_1763967 [Mycena galopus ATCC 62051]
MIPVDHTGVAEDFGALLICEMLRRKLRTWEIVLLRVSMRVKTMSTVFPDWEDCNSEDAHGPIQIIRGGTADARRRNMECEPEKTSVTILGDPTGYPVCALGASVFEGLGLEFGLLNEVAESLRWSASKAQRSDLSANSSGLVTNSRVT